MNAEKRQHHAGIDPVMRPVVTLVIGCCFGNEKAEEQFRVARPDGLRRSARSSAAIVAG